MLFIQETMLEVRSAQSYMHEEQLENYYCLLQSYMGHKNWNTFETGGGGWQSKIFLSVHLHATADDNV